jgi:ppGpp synthetase/RelA/SpoT-type nucleotidyltranferase
MPYPKFTYTRPDVNAAGRCLVNPTISSMDLEHALLVVNNWRAAHAFPLNTFQVSLRRNAKLIDSRIPVVAQRIKRLPAITLKLGLLPNLSLTQMQDIGGCRVILSSVPAVNRLVRLYERSQIKHELIRKDDYIKEPRDSGYRGIHLVYRYYSDRSKDYTGLKVEMQVRTRLQHAWATAVETVSTFKQQALKSGLGDEQWLRFFALMGSILAIRENRSLVRGTPDNVEELIRELKFYASELNVIGALTNYQLLLDNVPLGAFRGMPYFLLELSPKDGRLRIQRYTRRESETASREYLASELQARLGSFDERDAVLVSVDSLKALRAAYPNYFADTKRFVGEVRRALDIR